MRKTSTIFLQIVTILVGIGALTIMIRFPLTEGRAANLDLLSIYADPFIIYGYLASIAFFAALYQTLKLLRYIGQNKVFSINSVKALRIIKHCAVVLGTLIAIAGLYIRIFHAEGDDPAGFLALCIIAIFISVAAATATGMLERTLQKAVDIKSENDLTV